MTLSSSVRGGWSPGRATGPHVFEGPCHDSRAGRVASMFLQHMRHMGVPDMHQHTLGSVGSTAFTKGGFCFLILHIFLLFCSEKESFLLCGLGAVGIYSFLNSRQAFRRLPSIKYANNFNNGCRVIPVFHFSVLKRVSLTKYIIL